jgi:hypothetical protein
MMRDPRGFHGQYRQTENLSDVGPSSCLGWRADTLPGLLFLTQ